MLTRLSMMRKLLFTLIPLTIIVLLGMTLFVHTVIRNNTTTSVIDTTRKQATAEGERIVNRLLQNLASIQSLVTVAEMRIQLPIEKRRDYFNQILNRYLENHQGLLAAWTCWEPNAFDERDNQLINTAGHDTTGRFIPYWYRNGSAIKLEPLVDYEKPGAGDYYLLAKQTRHPIIMEPYLYPVGGVTKLITSLVIPVIEEGRFVGVVGVDMLVSYLQEQVEKIRPFGGVAALFSQQGIIIAHPDSTRLGKNMRDSESDMLNDELPQFTAAVTQGKSFMTQRTNHLIAGQTLTISEPISLGDTGNYWSIAMALPLDNVLADTNRLIQKVIFISLISLALLVILILILSKSLSTPLREVVSVLEDIANGEGDLTRRLPVKGSDEIAHLATAFNHFVDKIQGLVHQTYAAVTQLTAAAASLSNSSDNTNEQIERQRMETTQVATAMHEMTATVQEVARNANHAASAARDANKEAGKGEQIVQETVTAIEVLARDIERAAEVIRHLETDTDTIGKVLDVIRSIAEQTNLLALNAAIEAARAGEQGRGFAVVADEVRTLASRTQESTKEIQAMIERLQSGAESAVTAMQQSRARSNDTVTQAGRAGAALNSIATAIVRIDDMNTQIAGAAEEQSAVAEEINRNVTNITQSVDATAQGSQQIANSSEQLTRLANDLQARLQQFKI
ncbi:chemotaxis protein [Chromatium weissei]|nr:chemotaxis protein [Chromatium weissei]